MGSMPIRRQMMPRSDNNLWLNFDPHEDEKELWLLQQELTTSIERIDHKGEAVPIGMSANEPKAVAGPFVEEEEEEEEEEDDDDNDDDESESHDDEEEEVDMEVDDQPSVGEGPPTPSNQ